MKYALTVFMLGFFSISLVDLPFASHAKPAGRCCCHPNQMCRCAMKHKACPMKGHQAAKKVSTNDRVPVFSPFGCGAGGQQKAASPSFAKEYDFSNALLSNPNRHELNFYSSPFVTPLFLIDHAFDRPPRF